MTKTVTIINNVTPSQSVSIYKEQKIEGCWSRVSASIISPAGEINRRINELRKELKQFNPIINTISQLSSSGISILRKEAEILSKYIEHTTSKKFCGSTELLSIENSIDNLLKEYNE